MEWGLIGWIAFGIAILAASLATCYSRRKVRWGWLLFFVANVCWIIYGVTIQALPLITYNIFRAFFSLRGARNNSRERELEIIQLQEAKSNGTTNVGSKN